MSASGVSLSSAASGRPLIDRFEDQQLSSSARIHVDLSTRRDIDEELLRISDQTTSLNLAGCKLTGRVLERLCRFARLRFLDLSMYQNTSKIPKCASDQIILNLSGRNLTDEILERVSDRITYLNLDGCSIAGKPLQQLDRLTQLRDLNLSMCKNAEEILPHISDQITSLNLAGCKLTDETLEQLSRFTQLRVLNLSGCTQITNKGLHLLLRNHRLTALDLRDCDSMRGGQIADKWCRLITSEELQLLKAVLSICLSA
ncbi:MAG: hypothetical protein A3E80_03740 [Chlamydiae bacterium RIFCSPHIGHO2_12_FULL_49_9]|nr:MAG: hypothetical protein A3E80_03740 [Chlamydiae bacterium RIFCSPHIGHO2_12_FULL_49_9]